MELVLVCLLHLVVVSGFHQGDHDGVAIDFHQYHDVLGSSEWLFWKLVCLVREGGLSDVVHSCANIALHFTYLVT